MVGTPGTDDILNREATPAAIGPVSGGEIRAEVLDGSAMASAEEALRMAQLQNAINEAQIAGDLERVAYLQAAARGGTAIGITSAVGLDDYLAEEEARRAEAEAAREAGEAAIATSGYDSPAQYASYVDSQYSSLFSQYSAEARQLLTGHVGATIAGDPKFADVVEAHQAVKEKAPALEQDVTKNIADNEQALTDLRSRFENDPNLDPKMREKAVGAVDYLEKLGAGPQLRELEEKLAKGEITSEQAMQEIWGSDEKGKRGKNDGLMGQMEMIGRRAVNQAYSSLSDEEKKVFDEAFPGTKLGETTYFDPSARPDPKSVDAAVEHLRNAKGDFSSLSEEDKRAIVSAKAFGVFEVRRTESRFVSHLADVMENGKFSGQSIEEIKALKPEEKVQLFSDVAKGFMADNITSPETKALAEKLKGASVEQQAELIDLYLEKASNISKHRAGEELDKDQVKAFNKQYYEKTGAAYLAAAGGSVDKALDLVYDQKAPDAAQPVIASAEQSQASQKVQAGLKGAGAEVVAALSTFSRLLEGYPPPQQANNDDKSPSAGGRGANKETQIS